MWIKSWRRLAGCIAISCGLQAAAPEFRAGFAESGRVRAIVLEDRRGNRAVIADAQFTVTLATADFVAAQLLQAYSLNRAAILLHSTAAGEPAAREAITAIAAALGNLEPARVTFNGSSFSIMSGEGQCRAVFFPVAFAGCAGGVPVRGPIRSAFQVFEPEHGLQQRNQAPAAYPLQAIAFGKQATVLAIGGDTPVNRVPYENVIAISHCNDDKRFPEGGLAAAVKGLLARVGR